MASNQTKELWRSRIERLLATDMGVTAWCDASKVSDSSMFKWIGYFADAEPELFGGPQNIAGRDEAKWITRTRENMRASSAPIVPAGQEFVRIDVAPRAQAPDGPAPAAPAPAITVSIGAAVVSVPAGATVADGGETPVQIVKAGMPAVTPVEGSCASASLVAYIMERKYCMGLPLYRISSDLRASERLTVSRQAMAGWVVKSWEAWLSPVRDLMKYLLTTHVRLHIDDYGNRHVIATIAVHSLVA